MDTSVLLNLLRVPRHCDRAEEMQGIFTERHHAGAKFVLPVTAVIETGNHIEQVADGHERRQAALRFQTAITAAREASPPWTIREVEWGSAFLQDLLDGAGTGMGMVRHLAEATLGAGDLSILTERQVFLEQTGFTNVQVWTLDATLESYAEAGPGGI